MKKYREAPDLLKLQDREKFRDNEDNIFEVEIRGVRNEDQIFFKGKDIERVFEMDNLVDNISYSYTKDEDYEIFLLAQYHIVYGVGPVEKSQPRRIQSVFFTYNGLLKVIFNSRSGVAYKFRKWATKIIYTAHLGTDEQRVEQALNIAGVNASLVKQVFDTCVTRVPFGKTKSLHRRLMEHVKEYGGLECCELKLSQWSPIKETLISKAETQLSHYFRDKKIVFRKHVEIVILSRNDMVGVKGQYLDVYTKFGIVNDMLAISKETADLTRDQLLKEKDERIAELNDRIKDMMEQKQEWKQKEMKWENERADWKNERETLLEQNTLLLKKLSLQKK
ncbi:MAG: BRO family protein [Cetobacterium sp.]